MKENKKDARLDFLRITAVGGFMGVMVMCMFQINIINKYEWEILKLQKELEEREK